jgi:methylated-DNA-[protein]-cysteine S-methyltransferase
MEVGFTLFETAIGRCGIAWQGDALRGMQLPEPSEARDWARLRQRFPDLEPGEPPAWVREAIGSVQAFLSGGLDTDLAEIPLALDGVGEWERQVYEAARTIPTGRTLTYGELALQLGDPGKARAVGQALGRNPWPIVIPCHRITAAGGATGGFSAPGGATTKLKLLEIEGALAPNSLPLFAAAGD